MGICADKITLATVILLMGTSCVGQKSCSDLRSADAKTTPDVTLNMTCGRNGDFVVTWTTLNTNSVLNVQIEYTCSDISGDSSQDALQLSSNELSKSSSIPGKWTACTVWGCYETTRSGWFLTAEKNCQIPLTTNTSAVPLETSSSIWTSHTFFSISETNTNASSRIVAITFTETAEISIAETVIQAEELTFQTEGAFATALVPALTALTATLFIIMTVLTAIILAIRKRGRRNDNLHLAGLTNAIQKIEVDLTPQRYDAKSVHSGDIVYNNLVFAQDKVEDTEDPIRSTLDDILYGADGDRSMNEYVDESPIQEDSHSDTKLNTRYEALQESDESNRLEMNRPAEAQLKETH